MEEPDILNTPKTLTPATTAAAGEENPRLSRRLFPLNTVHNNNNNRSNISEHNDSISGNIPPLKETNTGRTDSTTVPRSKRIIGVKSGKKEEKVDAYCRHPAPTSQVNEYENISPTPSTDL